MTILAQINTNAQHVGIIAEGVIRTLRPHVTDEQINVVCESAVKYLGAIALQMRDGRLQDDIERVIDTITGLRVIGKADNREAFNIKAPTFKVLITKAGEAENVDAALSRLAKSPSVASVRKEVERLITAAAGGEGNAKAKAINAINKLRLGYERVQHTLGGDATQ